VLGLLLELEVTLPWGDAVDDSRRERFLEAERGNDMTRRETCVLWKEAGLGTLVDCCRLKQRFRPGCMWLGEVELQDD
jgi:hypothetical protein